MITIGEELKREREYREISLREISDATKINIRMLEAIEKDDFGILPGGIFNRNFIRAYADFIGLDSEVIIRKYQVQTGVEHTDTSLPASIVARAVKEKKKVIRTQWILISAGILIIALLVFLVWRYPDKLPFSLRSEFGATVSPLFPFA
jgi:cytoskeletal protein RodZ